MNLSNKYFSISEINKIIGMNFKTIQKSLIKDSCKKFGVDFWGQTVVFVDPENKKENETMIELLDRTINTPAVIVIYENLNKPNTSYLYYKLTMISTVGNDDRIELIKKAFKLHKLKAFL